MDQPPTIPQGWKAKKHHNSALHRATGETAIVQTNDGVTAYAQFDRFDHPQSHGWHAYPKADFQFGPEDPPPDQQRLDREYDALSRQLFKEARRHS